MVTRAPEASEVSARVAKTQKFRAPWARSFSSGRQVCKARVVPPVKRKFQPTPSRNKAARNWCKSTPESAITMHNTFNTTPIPMIVKVPNRRIKCPVKNPGANMPITCHSSTSAMSENGRLHCCMAMGVAAISKFITPKPNALPMAATMNTGCAMISLSGRPPAPFDWGGAGANCMNDIKPMASNATSASDK